jgi:hypothetical protein
VYISTYLKTNLVGSMLLCGIFVTNEGYAQKPSNSGTKSKKMNPKAATPAQRMSKEPAQGVDASSGPANQQVNTSPNNNHIEPQTINDSSSGSIRSRRPFGAQLSYTPLSDFVLQFGGALHYNMGSTWQFGGSGLFGSQDLSSKVSATDGTKIPTLTLSGSAIDFFARWHPMQGTFSTKFGLGYRRATANYRIDSSATFVEGTLDITSVVVPIFLGNHWSFDNGFQIGCDWIGAYVPLTGAARSTLSSNEPTTTSGSLASSNQSIVTLGESLATKTSLTLAVINLGYQF